MNSYTNNAAAGGGRGGGRRILHQPFFPVESSPTPPQTPAVSSPPKEPFSGDQSPFFPTYPSPPPPPSASALATFPANISSLPIPHSSPSPHSPVSPALVVVTVALSVFAVAVAVFSIFLYFRGRRHRRSSTSDDEEDENKHRTASRSDIAAPPPHPPVPPRLQKNSANNSSEFLYLGTMVNSRAVNGGAAGRKGAFDPRKTDSPDLQPLPPLARTNLFRNADENYGVVQEEEEESFYSPRGSASGRESSLGVGSDSRRAFAAAQNIARIEADSSPECSSSGTGSPARSASLSISPPVSGSTKSSKPKSSPTPSPQLPPLPQLPPMTFSHSHSPPPPPEAYSSPSPDRDSEVKTKEEEEAEESPLLSNASSSSERSSPAESPCLSPLWSMAGKSSPSPPPAGDWSVFDRNRLSPISDRSTPSRKSSSIKLPRFLGGSGGSKKASSESTKMSNSPASSPESSVTASPISSASQSSSSKISYSPGRNTISHPSSPSPVADSPRRPQSTPASPNLAGRRMQSTPASPCFSSKGSQQSSPEVRQLNNIKAPPPGLPPPPPPPPPRAMPPPPMRRSESPISPLPVSKLSTARGVEPENSVKVFGSELDSSNGEAVDANESTLKPKLKPLHWDKVRASSDREMVWDQLRCSSFKLNEEMIETLFGVKNPNSKPKETVAKLVEPSPRQDNRVLDSKKAQNIAISLRALNVTVDEVCEALLEGNAETLGTELLESLLKMAPTKEEEWKLREYKDDSPCKLGHAEKFLKTLICIPFAFKRVEAMLYVANFESEVEYLKKSFETLENACEELRSSRMFLKLLEAVLKTGNRMNVGTNRGDAHAFKLDTLLKLVDVKGTDGKTTLLHFVVQEMIRTEGARLCNVDQAAPKAPTANDDAKCRKLGLQVVSCLSSELANVKKAAAMDSDSLTVEVAKLSMGLASIAEVVSSNEKMGSQESSRKFSESMSKFISSAEMDIIRVQAQESVALSLVKEITEYFHGDSAKEEAHPFRIFMVVRDFLAVLDRVCREVGTINDRTVVTSGHRFPVPVNPMLPVPVNPTVPQGQGLTELFHQYRRHSSSSDGESSIDFNRKSL